MKSLSGILAAFSFVLMTNGAELSPEQHFLERVKPLLDSRCVSCHGADKVKGGLRLDSREAALRGGDSGPSIIAGKPHESLLVKAIMHTAPDLQMPPKEKLTPKDIEVFEKWIRDGVPWPKADAVAVVATKSGERIGDAWSDPRNPITRIFGGQRIDLWSLKAPERATPPQVQTARWIKTPVDNFVLDKLEIAGLQASPEADARTLARRVYFDLTGLPPTPEQMEAFLKDRSPGAYERLVDDLLNSPRYGERWAREWLDVIRYSDSNGFDWDEYRPKAWRFRDYVIRSFNADKPFDQFIKEQLAGDELIAGEPQNEREQDYLIATGYLRLGPHDNSAPLFNEQARSRAELMNDLVETTGSAFLALTMNCCRCHDHKFDPLSHADFFRMRAFFEGVKFADDLPLDLAPEQKRIRERNTEIDAAIKPLQEKRDGILNEVKAKLRAAKVAELPAEDRDLLALSKEKQTDEQKAKFNDLEKKVDPSDKDITAALSEEQKKETEKLAKDVGELKKQKLPFTLGLLMTDASEEPPVTKVLFQGDHKQEREPVVAGFISALDPNPAPISKGANAKTLGRRLTLANWIASPENPYTARVMANRIWQAHFGRGLVETANDFGVAGAKPTHPELLDWLATEFVRQGWSVKKLHRLILLSATYRQSASAENPAAIAVDPDNKLLWRQNLRRVTAEQLRDALFAVSGSLNERMGGPPVWPELAAEVLQANPAFLDDNAEKTKGWYPSPVPERTVRSIYMVQKRTVRVPFMETFDLPENMVSCARRNESIVAPQALSLLNSADALNAARAFATRVEREAGSDKQAQVRRAFTLALQRAPDQQELQLCEKLLAQRSLPELCRALLNLNEFVYLD